MINGKSVLAVIPARGGSKRVPHKNSRLLLGKPLIVYSIEAAVQSRYIDEVVVSTDDAEIAELAKKAGASVPFMRPAELATDEASSVDVVCHALQYYQTETATSFDFIILLQPTSPLRRSVHIDQAFEQLKKNHAEAVVSVCEAEHSPLWANQLPTDGSMADFLSLEKKNTRSQDLPCYYRLNGAIYICDTLRFLQEKNFFISDHIFAYRMEQLESVDIDTELDFIVCEAILNHMKPANGKRG